MEHSDLLLQERGNIRGQVSRVSFNRCKAALGAALLATGEFPPTPEASAGGMGMGLPDATAIKLLEAVGGAEETTQVRAACLTPGEWHKVLKECAGGLKHQTSPPCWKIRIILTYRRGGP